MNFFKLPVSVGHFEMNLNKYIILKLCNSCVLIMSCSLAIQKYNIIKLYHQLINNRSYNVIKFNILKINLIYDILLLFHFIMKKFITII